MDFRFVIAVCFVNNVHGSIHKIKDAYRVLGGLVCVFGRWTHGRRQQVLLIRGDFLGRHANLKWESVVLSALVYFGGTKAKWLLSESKLML